jgi:hypothetical protein
MMSLITTPCESILATEADYGFEGASGSPMNFNLCSRGACTHASRTQTQAVIDGPAVMIHNSVRPAWAYLNKSVLMYRRPESIRIVTTVALTPICCARRRATITLSPEDVPANMPSSCARRRHICIASAEVAD